MGGWLAEIMLRVRDRKVPQEPALKITPLATEPREGVTASVHKELEGQLRVRVVKLALIRTLLPGLLPTSHLFLRQPCKVGTIIPFYRWEKRTRRGNLPQHHAIRSKESGCKRI